MTLTGKTLEENVKTVQKYEKFCDVVELRVDYLTEDEQLVIRNFPSLISKPCILTIRRDIDGGKWTGGDFSRTNLFGRALAFADQNKARNFAYVDFEEDYHIPSIQDAAMAFGVKIIRSCHNMTEPVTNLRERCDSMRKTGYEIPKIAFMPKTLSDVVNLFQQGAKISYDHILCAMGPEGFPSRILPTFSNSYLTYTSPEETIANTDNIGHISPHTLEELYHFSTVTKETKLFGITGWPLKKTSSPLIHNYGYKTHNMDALYLPIRSQLVSEALNFAEQLNVQGMSVTIPFKESVLYYLHEQSPEVMQIGACNTIVRRNFKWYGYNTDAIGFERSLLEFLGPGVKTKKMKVAIIGAGGAAKAIAYTVKKLGMRACIFNRTVEHAQEMAERFDFEYSSLDAHAVETLDEYSQLIIQTTSVGMNSDAPSSKENDPIYFYKFRGNEMIFDIIYTPAVTPVMKRAAASGCKVCNGYKMLEYQAYEQFKLFTGEDY